MLQKATSQLPICKIKMLAAKLCCMLVCNMNQGGERGAPRGHFLGIFGNENRFVCQQTHNQMVLSSSLSLPGTSAASVLHRTVPSISAGPLEATHEARLRANEAGHCVSSKNPSRVRDGDEGVAGRNRWE